MAYQPSPLTSAALPGALAQRADGLRDAVRGVVVAGPAAEGEPAGQGQRAAGVVEGEAELGRRHLDHDGEARVEVDEGDVVDAQPGLLEGRATGEADGGGAVQLGPLGNEPVVVGVGAGEGEDPALLGHPGGAGRRRPSTR